MAMASVPNHMAAHGFNLTDFLSAGLRYYHSTNLSNSRDREKAKRAGVQEFEASLSSWSRIASGVSVCLTVQG